MRLRHRAKGGANDVSVPISTDVNNLSLVKDRATRLILYVRIELLSDSEAFWVEMNKCELGKYVITKVEK